MTRRIGFHGYGRHGGRWLASLVAVGGLALPAACGSGHSTAVRSAAGRSAPAAGATASMPGMTMPSGSAARPQGAPVATNSVAIKSFAFTPATASVRVGTTVTWTNQDEEPHTVTAGGGSFHSAPLTPGQTFRYTFTKPGRYPYICTIHPFMHGTVVVTR